MHVCEMDNRLATLSNNLLVVFFTGEVCLTDMPASHSRYGSCVITVIQLTAVCYHRYTANTHMLSPSYD